MKRATPFGRPHRSVGGTRGQENTGIRQLCSGAGRTGTAFLTAPDATGRGTTVDLLPVACTATVFETCFPAGPVPDPVG